MKCDKIHSELMDAVLGGPQAMSSNLRQHLQECPACAQELASFQRTMAVLDEWQAPEPSPYFSARLRARVRELAATADAGLLSWLRRPALATAAAALVALGIGLLQGAGGHVNKVTMSSSGGVVLTQASATAVSDLQYLDRNADLFAEFDALDGQSSTQ